MIPLELPDSLQSPPAGLLWAGPMPKTDAATTFPEANQVPLLRLHRWLLSVCDGVVHRKGLVDWMERPTKAPISHALWLPSSESAFQKERRLAAEIPTHTPASKLLAVRSDRVSARPQLPGQPDFVPSVSLVNAGWYLPDWLQDHACDDQIIALSQMPMTTTRVELYASDVEIGEACLASLSTMSPHRPSHTALTTWDDYALGGRRRSGEPVVCVWDDSMVSPFDLRLWQERRRSRPRPDVVGHVWLTHRCNQSQWDEAAEAGVDAVVEKPFPQTVLRTAIVHARVHGEQCDRKLRRGEASITQQP
ncbi:MAG: hypothetical protein AAGD07_14745 [Planctomycetota bacterium]